MNRIGLLDGIRTEEQTDESDHQDLSQTIASRGTVLLKNEGLLPLASDTDIAVLGPSVRETTSGGGSSEMDAPHEVTTAEGLRNRADDDVTVARGVPEIEQVSFFDRGEDDTDEAAEPDLEDAVAAAATSAVAVVVVQDTATEAKDRESLRLPGQQEELIEEVAAVNDQTAVVVQSSGPVEMPWRSDAAAVLETWYPGQSDGDAIAEVLFGDVDAGGRLPVTFAQESDYPTENEGTFQGGRDRLLF